MIRLYAIIFIVAILGGVAYAAKYYYDTTQATIAQLRENNAKLEVANEENQATIKKMDENNKSYIAPRQRGSIILFDSRTPHRVQKVRSGERKSIVGWVVGPRWK